MCDAQWYQEFLNLNPRERKRRDLTVDYAELQADMLREYFRRLFPRYWLEADRYPPGTAGSSLGLTRDQEIKIIADMSQIVLPAFRASSEYTLPHDAAAMKFPPR